MELDTTPLNNEWIRKFDETDQLYKDFYKDDIYYTNLNIIYLNNDNEIEKIKQESFLLSQCNYITTEEIIKILKENLTDQSKKYSLLSIFFTSFSMKWSSSTFFACNFLYFSTFSWT